MDSLWLYILNLLEQSLPAQEFSQWILPLQARDAAGGLLFLQAPSRFHADWVREHYLELINSHCKSLDPALSARLQAGPGKKRPVKATNISLAGLAPEVNRCGVQTFDTFVPAPFNHFAYTAAQTICRQKTSSFNPLFVEAASGLGKTHLLQAIGEALKAEIGPQVACLDSRKILEKSGQDPGLFFAAMRNLLASMKVLLIDDVHLLAVSDVMQQRLIKLFDDFYNLDKQMIFTSTRLPHLIDGLVSGLRSRLAWGLIARINEPDSGDRLRVTEALLDRAGLPSSSQICRFLARSRSFNFHEIEKNVEKLQSLVENQGKPPEVKELLACIQSTDTPSTTLSMRAIQQALCRTYGLSMDGLLGTGKSRPLVTARQAGMYLSRKLLGSTYAAIGASFGGRDHSTVIYACRKIGAEIKRNRDFAERLVQIENNLLKIYTI